MINNLTTHAKRRAAQRGINSLMFALIEAYGEEAYLQNGSKVLYLNKRAIEEIESEGWSGCTKLWGRKVFAYAIVSREGDWITTGIRYKRIKQ